MSAPLLALTMGDPAGIGPEIIVRALADPVARAGLRPLVVADARVIEQAVASTGAALAVRRVAGPADVAAGPDVAAAGPDVAAGPDGAVDVLDLDNVGSVDFGRVDGGYGRAAVTAIETACRLARAGQVDGIVTAPINKEAIRKGGSTFPGHTEMLADLLGVPAADVVTMFVLDRLRIFFLTRHASLRDTIDGLTEDGVRCGLVRVAELLGELGVDAPRIACAALNPHAGENGLLGREEIDILRPAVERARAEGVDAALVPADAAFFQAREGRFDGVLSLYHDQGHVAAKTVDFFGTVSCTLGLPVIRTSVDHGTAFDIAGKGIADARGQVAALRVAAALAPEVLRVRRAQAG